MSLRTIILAGQRAGEDPSNKAFDVAFKADLPVKGRAMLDRVATALDEAGLSRPFILSGYPTEKEGFSAADFGDGPVDSAIKALEGGPFPALLTTCDHALLTPDIVHEFLEKSRANNADLSVGFATKSVIQASYPNTKRTYLKFSDVSVSGCNLFYFANDRAVNALRYWVSVQHLRKTPVRLAWRVGGWDFLRYVLGRLSFARALEQISVKSDVKVAAAIIDQAEAAIDVDSVADLHLVEAILAKRETGS